MKWNKVITSEAEYDKAMARITKIFDAPQDSPEGMEAELLVTLIEKYEQEKYPVSLPDPIEAIKEAMTVKSLKDKDLIPAVGSKSGVSHILNRKRFLTIDMVRRLHELLNIPVEVLVQPYELSGNSEHKELTS